jgi:hypothetical protein
MVDEEQRMELVLEEWKTTRSTIVELDHMLSNIRSLTVTVTIVLIGVGVEYSSSALFLLVIFINFIFWLLEIHYHRYLGAMSSHARTLELKLGFELTTKLYDVRNEYKNKPFIFNLKGNVISNIYHYIYFAFMVVGFLAIIYLNWENIFSINEVTNSTSFI